MEAGREAMLGFGAGEGLPEVYLWWEDRASMVCII